MLIRPTIPAVHPLALVTGASSGIGEAFARALAARGYDLALTARRTDRLEALGEDLARSFGIQAFAIPQDLAELGAHQAILDAVTARGRHVDMLVNNAGFSIAESFAAVPWSRQQAFLMTLVVNACGLAHGVIPAMVERGRGRIVNVASMAAFAPGVAGHSLYPGAKSLMLTFSQALDAEYGPRGLKVTAVCPGFTATEFAQTNGTADVMDASPRRLFQTPEQVVAATLAANDAGRVVVIPGWHNALAASLMRALPAGLVRAILMRASAKYHLED
ncbi:MAG: SDR family NAD(P)-dependent oxidoreductase [Alphaproteobacteria bacterium]|nr:SDR family NAD(P)-dependent oxidoreductase [Alphaproteobacteria bacterium]MBU1515646.1 SDR family NAD(P)-dependent oxidoreductase [Alphaproteobacteria bacterium]MBU2094905.1 SDR family NAD(P)-dependent oxidoreductase [Alphaproteobacteria bacterium]MBU2150937.1 SDR family NAD(P)-dependent oxidoreductase [Alphaproteobacteria bacterium]MBU2305914.1 SDR family NAD(P)-dependent oxidoreductase [Alphaproteobacteria bacterium]